MEEMTTEPKPYVPFTAQQGLEAYEIPALDERVTPHLAPHLWEWCSGILQRNPKMCDRMSLQMRLVLGNRPIDILSSMVREKPDMMLNIAQWLVAEGNLVPVRITELEQLLSDAGSAYLVDRAESTLRRRLPREEEEEMRIALAMGDATATHLRDACTAAWRRDDPSAVEAFDSAVKAIESILVPIVIPKHPTPTLGKVIRALEDKPEKWDTRFRGEETVTALAAMLDELWRTQVRHHKSDYLENTLDEAQDAVTIAVAVVGLCRRGFLERVEDYSPEEEAEDLAIAEAALERYQSGNLKTVPYEDVVADWVADEARACSHCGVDVPEWEADGGAVQVTR